MYLELIQKWSLITTGQFTNVHDVVALRVVSEPVVEQSKFCIAEGHRVWLRGEEGTRLKSK